eukprot:1162066-Pelagomonas_calceolata.AAC.4
MSVLSETVPSGAVCVRGVAGLGQETSAFPLQSNTKVVPDNFAHCKASYLNLDDPITVFAWPVCQVSGWKLGLGALAKNYQNLFQTNFNCTNHNLPSPSSTAEPPETFPWHACQVLGWGCSGWARAAGVNFFRGKANLGAHAP